MYVHICIYIYIYMAGRPRCATPPPCPLLRCWRNTVEILLFEISNLMKPYPSVFHAYTSKFRPVTRFVEPKQLDEASNRFQPVSHLPLSYLLLRQATRTLPPACVQHCANFMCIHCSLGHFAIASRLLLLYLSGSPIFAQHCTKINSFSMELRILSAGLQTDGQGSYSQLPGCC